MRLHKTATSVKVDLAYESFFFLLLLPLPIISPYTSKVTWYCRRLHLLIGRRPFPKAIFLNLRSKQHSEAHPATVDHSPVFFLTIPLLESHVGDDEGCGLLLFAGLQLVGEAFVDLVEHSSLATEVCYSFSKSAIGCQHRIESDRHLTRRMSERRVLCTKSDCNLCFC